LNYIIQNKKSKGCRIYLFIFHKEYNNHFSESVEVYEESVEVQEEGVWNIWTIRL